MIMANPTIPETYGGRSLGHSDRVVSVPRIKFRHTSKEKTSEYMINKLANEHLIPFEKSPECTK
jgi:hypothetical protein